MPSIKDYILEKREGITRCIEENETKEGEGGVGRES
jgi:hypothetical protein